MISYQSNATREAQSEEARRFMHAKGYEGFEPKPGARNEGTAKAHADALARRNAG